MVVCRGNLDTTPIAAIATLLPDKICHSLGVSLAVITIQLVLISHYAPFEGYAASVYLEGYVGAAEHTPHVKRQKRRNCRNLLISITGEHAHLCLYPMLTITDPRKDAARGPP